MQSLQHFSHYSNSIYSTFLTKYKTSSNIAKLKYSTLELAAMLPHTAALLLSFYVACASALAIRGADDEQCVIEYVTVYTNGPSAGTGSTASPSTVSMSTTYHIPTHMPVPLKQAGSSVDAQGSGEGSSSAMPPTTAAAEATSGTMASTQSSAASSSSAPSTAGTKSNITPGGKKAGISGYVNIAMKADWSQFTPHISWYSDYTPNPPDSGDVKGIGMVRTFSLPSLHVSHPICRPLLSITLIRSTAPFLFAPNPMPHSKKEILQLSHLLHQTYKPLPRTNPPNSSGATARKAQTTPPGWPPSNPSSRRTHRPT